MRVVGLISGGKDSCFNLMNCVALGHEIVALANLCPPKNHPDERDSMMYQTVGHDFIELISQCLELPLFRRCLETHDERVENVDWENEVHDLYFLLEMVKREHDIEAVSVGAILSTYQRERVEQVCNKLGLKTLAYLWCQDQKSLLNEMIDCDLNAILVKVASLGLDQRHLGKSLAQMKDHLYDLERKFGGNVCGEGGEFETITLDCPIFKKRIVIEESEVVVHSNDAFAPVLYLKPKILSVKEKQKEEVGLTEEMKRIIIKKHLQNFDWERDLCTKILEVPRSVNDTEIACFENFTNINTFSAAGDIITTSALFCTDCNKNITEKSRFILSLVKSRLEELNSSMSCILMIHVYVRSMSDFALVNSVFSEFFDVHPPSRACVSVNISKDIDVYMDVIASVGSLLHLRQALHVQGISYWAPANIGPYSQTINYNGTYFYAGQIGLIPPTMSLPAPVNVNEETLYILKSIKSLLDYHKLDISQIQSAIVYLVTENDVDLVKLLLAKFGLKNNFAFVIVKELPRQSLVEIQINVCKRNPIDNDHSYLDFKIELCHSNESVQTKLFSSKRPNPNQENFVWIPAINVFDSNGKCQECICLSTYINKEQ
ncbi:Rossmann-like alpha/beta/alpha sandwich fold domain-containing protein [Rozella allomycis CSF55]|uniref:Diphthine--ammonia ligase n=1 Tax=Rozella allomycis (strain CSF55) TaxID=988480 RepID=A0A075ARX6_ROZAC|nr:Rossmann-like alpha/beta/alpha sandwich fold domain-containing protein [Rozella allomycis CSF55]|eukprot:EPZ31293.1 Rossmann-like alpha/beta/alpha sandwich fold domain-containing protein [Rozella allomycis CSF55]